MELRLILGDQLNINHSWFNTVNPEVCFVLMEIKAESEYLTHHIQKVCCFFAAMREFAEELRHLGHKVRYFNRSKLELTPVDSEHFLTNLGL
ncbi:MAG: cryptochrome/photolyase family protein [Flavobacteriales bacterium]